MCFNVASTHALVSFIDEDDEPTCVVRTTRLKGCLNVTPGIECGVNWSDGNAYTARVIAVGEFLAIYHFSKYMCLLVRLTCGSYSIELCAVL